HGCDPGRAQDPDAGLWAFYRRNETNTRKLSSEDFLISKPQAKPVSSPLSTAYS
ncbi:hypothetical protein M9458_044037, partial [Cirrhinus mrigala]